MDRDTLKTWVGDPAEAPEEARVSALTVRAFLVSDEPEAHRPDLAGLPAEIAVALVGILAAAGDAQRLALLRDSARDKVARKAAAKALHDLRSRGILVPAAKKRTAADGVRPVAIGAPAPPPSWITPHDPSGAALTILGAWDASYGPFFVLAVEGEDRGLQVSDIVRGATRKMERELIREMHLEDQGVPVSAAVAKACLAAAVRRTRAAGRPLPDGWSLVAPFVAGADESLARPSVELTGDAPGTLATTPPELALILGSWFPDATAYNEAALALHTAASTQLAVSDRQRAEFVADALSRHLDAWFDAARRTAWALRFERAALVLEHRGQERVATVALAAAAYLRDLARPASDHPVLRRRFEQLFDLRDLLESFRTGEHPDSALDDLDRSGEQLLIRP